MSTTVDSKRDLNGTRRAKMNGSEHHDEVASVVDELMARTFPDDSAYHRFAESVLARVGELRRKDSSATASESQSGLFDGCPGPRAGTGKFGMGKAAIVADLRKLVSEAYLSMFAGKPEDHVIIDPTANREFVCRCQLLGAEVSEFELNRTLLNLRKAGVHAGLDRGCGSALAREELDSIGFAAEISAKLLQLEAAKNGWVLPSIDRILCDPALRNRFDTACLTLAPGFSEYQYRLAVLSYRKSGREATHRLGAISPPAWEADAPMRELDPDDAPNVAGVYSVYAGNKSIFTSATMNLRNRLLAHLRVDNGSRFLPPSVFESSWRRVVVRWFEAPLDWKPRKADAVALRITRESKSMFNLYADAV